MVSTVNDTKRLLVMRITISEKNLWYFAFGILIVKSVFYLFYRWFELDTLFGGGNDADYYHNYALGYVRVSVNQWSIILRSVFPGRMPNGPSPRFYEATGAGYIPNHGDCPEAG